MGLSHYNNSKAAVNNYEVVNGAQFECTILLPFTDANQPLLIEHIMSIGGLDGINPSIGTVEQRYKQATRSYAGKPDTTSIDLSFTFSLNLSDTHENYIYTTLRKWKNMIFDPATGAEGLKRDYVGSLVIVEYDRDGSIWRKITFKNVFPTGELTGIGDLDYSTGNDAQQLTMNVRADVWNEEVVGL